MRKTVLCLIGATLSACATLNPYPDVDRQYAKDVCSERDNYRACMRERQAELEQFHCDDHPEDRKRCDMDYRDRKGRLP